MQGFQKHLIPLLIYILFGLAAGLIVFYGMPVKAQGAAPLGDGSLKDAVILRTEIQRTAVRPERPVPPMPLPAPKPEGARNLYSSTDAEWPVGPLPSDRSRRMLLTCSSYYSITTSILAPVAREEAAEFRRKGIAALRQADRLRLATKTAMGDWIKEQDDIFLMVFEQYVNSPAGDAVGLYDRYNEVCDVVVRPLLQKEE